MPGYPEGLLKNRSVVKHGNYAVITPEGRVINTVPGLTDCKMTILATPKMGASFVQLIGTLGPNAKSTITYGAKPHEEAFIYLLDGTAELKVKVGDKTQTLKQGGYAYAPPGTGIDDIGVVPAIDGLAFVRAIAGNAQPGDAVTV